MGWWFYTIYVKIGFIRGIVEHEHASDPGVRDERGILCMVQREMRRQKSKARVKFHADKPFFARYWAWLMR